MKLRVNLYSESLFPAEIRLSFLRLNQLLAGLVLVLLLSSAVAYGLVSSLQSEKGALQQTKTTLDRQKTELEGELAKRQPSAALVAEVELKAQQLELKQMLMGKLSQQEALTSFGYSPLMTDLASVADRSIWLKRIQVNENRYIFEGYTSSPQSVPNWIDRLKTTTTLKGHAFASMTMSLGENQPLAFKLTSDAETGTNAVETQQ
ncbi:PilN domain-containing protein [Shewanella sp. KX20019]|uniref:PilN domain-containing protein n=1 Tax=Shewanella sp. KX20019 TaxID=2803864 RepID=UPI001925E234|nr:PilN domain-containing protein [Shewanella sp. KX20019]QQX79725.1 PilN domain-containing protein [Shewanella sp. KX20019]